MGITEQLAVLVAGLSNRNEVFAVSGERDGTALAEHVHALAAAGEERWEPEIDPRNKPISVADVGAALESIPREPAGRRLIELASRSMVYTYDIMDGDRAKKLTEELVTLLGEDAEWFSNQDPGGETSWSPVTRCTFDGVVAATTPTHFAILLQLGED